MWKRLDQMISSSDKFPKLGFNHMTLWAMMLPHTDSRGRYLANLSWIKGQVLPFFDVRLEQIEASLGKLAEVGLIHLYDAAGKKYLVYHDHADFNTGGAMANMPSKWPDPPPSLCVCVVCLKERRVSGAGAGGDPAQAAIVSSRLLSSRSSGGSGGEEPGKPMCKLCAHSRLTEITLTHERHGDTKMRIACPECDIDGFHLALETQAKKGWRVPTPQEAPGE